MYACACMDVYALMGNEEDVIKRTALAAAQYKSLKSYSRYSISDLRVHSFYPAYSSSLSWRLRSVRACNIEDSSLSSNQSKEKY